MAEITDVLLKLFDTLKDEIKDLRSLSHALLDNQNSFVNHISNLPMEETKKLLEDHSKDSSDEIGTCTETVETTSEKIQKSVEGMTQKVDRMILVIKVAFALFGAAILIGGITFKYLDSVDKKVVEKQKTDEHEQLRQELRQDIKEALEEFKKSQ